MLTVLASIALTAAWVSMSPHGTVMPPEAAATVAGAAHG
jgi:hypothetical protein